MDCCYAEYSSCLNAFSVWFILQVPGAMEFGITSDDVFWLKESPKKNVSHCYTEDQTRAVAIRRFIVH